MGLMERSTILLLVTVLSITLAGCGGDVQPNDQTTSTTESLTQTSTPVPDSDDGINGTRERELGTDPGDADTDGDGLPDADEVEEYGTESDDAINN